MIQREATPCLDCGCSVVEQTIWSHLTRDAVLYQWRCVRCGRTVRGRGKEHVSALQRVEHQWERKEEAVR